MESTELSPKSTDTKGYKPHDDQIIGSSAARSTETESQKRSTSSEIPNRKDRSYKRPKPHQHDYQPKSGASALQSAKDQEARVSRSTSQEFESGRKEDQASKTQISSTEEAKNVGSTRNVLVLGSARAGKYTIARHIATPDGPGHDFPKQNSAKGTGQVHRYSHQGDGCDYNFFIIDTAGAQTHPQPPERLSASFIKSEIKDGLKHGISLIIAVVRKDCCTLEELSSLAYIIDTLFKKEAREHIALVHTGCENLECDEKSKYLELFKGSHGPAGQLTCMCQKDIFAVGLPNLEEVRKEYLQLYQDSEKDSRAALKALVKSCKNMQPHAALLNDARRSDKLFEINSNPNCLLM